MKRALIAIFMLSLLSMKQCNEFMFPYGAKYNDFSLLPVHNDTAKVYLENSFPFWGTTVKTVYIDSNGAIWLNMYCNNCEKPKSFPVQTGYPMMACYWADTDISLNPNSHVYFRLANSTDSSWHLAKTVLNKAFTTKPPNVTSPQFNYQSTAKTLLIATWLNVTYANGDKTTPTNSFQCSIMSDGANTYTFFDYISLLWANSLAEENKGNYAIVGIDNGVNGASNNFSLPHSHTVYVTNEQNSTNFVQLTNSGGPQGWYAIKQASLPVQIGYPIPSNAESRSCWANGDPHYFTFDNHNGLDNLFGKSVTHRQPDSDEYYLTALANCKSCSYPQFRIKVILAIWEGDGGSKPLTTPGGLDIQFTLDGNNFTIVLNDNYFTVGDGQKYTSSYTCSVFMCPKNTFWISANNWGYQVETNFKLYATYFRVPGNGGYVQVNLPYIDCLRANLFGFCGNMNNNPKDDNMCSDSAFSSANNYQFCWMEDSLPPHDSSYCHSSINNEKSSSNTYFLQQTNSSEHSLAAQQCNLLIDPNGVFKDCQTIHNLYAIYSSCLFDLEAANGDNNVFCGYATLVVQSCLVMPNVTDLNWRSDSFCPPQCQYNSHYEPTTSRCIPTCSDPLADKFCSDPSTEGCICNDGFIYNTGQCIEIDQCDGCLDESGNYQSKGNSWLTSNCKQACLCAGSNNVVCTSNNCDSHAQCVVKNSAFNCQCQNGYFGDGYYCSPSDKCLPKNDCQNNSTCVTDKDLYICLCPSGYTGQYCETKIDYCIKNACQNGTCFNTLHGYKCDCNFGYTGANCDQKMNWCSSFPCTNLATCLSSGETYQCVCLPGYSGPQCECLFPSLDCTSLSDGNYADPCLRCANNYYSCVGGRTWIMYCYPGLYFDSVSNTCKGESDVPVCNGLSNSTRFPFNIFY